MTSHHAFLIGLLAALAIPAPLKADDLAVPGDFATIQEAIDASADGDRVLVGPGTWIGDLDLSGHDITLEALQGPGLTTLKGSGGSVLTRLGDGAPPDGVVVRGFTITGGSGTFDPGTGLNRGGGLFLDGDDLLLDRCHVVDNAVSGDGGGVFARLLVAGSSLRVTDSLLARNTAGRFGGGAAAFQVGLVTAVLSDCTIEDNSAVDGGGVVFTGGFGLAGSRLARNRATGDGGGAWIAYVGNTMSISGAHFVENEAGRDGGGLYFDTLNDFPIAVGAQVSDLRLLGNRCGRSGGGAFFRRQGIGGSALTWDDCLVAGNEAGVSGGGAWVDLFGGSDAIALFRRNTFFANVAPVSGAALRFDSNGLFFKSVMQDCIVWDHATPALDIGALPLAFCDVQGGAPGTGNIDADPQFVDATKGAFLLMPSSPARGSGSLGGDMGALGGAVAADLDVGTHGSVGRPRLFGEGDLTGDSIFARRIEPLRPLVPTLSIASVVGVCAPLFGGVLVPAPTIVDAGPLPDAEGVGVKLLAIPAGVPPGFIVYWQFLQADPAALNGLVVTGGMVTVTP